MLLESYSPKKKMFEIIHNLKEHPRKSSRVLISYRIWTAKALLTMYAFYLCHTNSD